MILQQFRFFLPYILIMVVIVAVAWETVHLVQWTMNMFEMYGDGTLAGYLRMHAYTYVSFVFGDDLGWVVS